MSMPVKAEDLRELLTLMREITPVEAMMRTGSVHVPQYAMKLLGWRNTSEGGRDLSPLHPTVRKALRVWARGHLGMMPIESQVLITAMYLQSFPRMSPTSLHGTGPYESSQGQGTSSVCDPSQDMTRTFDHLPPPETRICIRLPRSLAGSDCLKTRMTLYGARHSDGTTMIGSRIPGRCERFIIGYSDCTGPHGRVLAVLSAVDINWNYPLLGFHRPRMGAFPLPLSSLTPIDYEWLKAHPL